MNCGDLVRATKEALCCLTEFYDSGRDESLAKVIGGVYFVFTTR